MATDACLAFGLASEQGSHTGTWDAFQAFPTGSFLIGTRVRWGGTMSVGSSSWGPQAHGALKRMGPSSAWGPQAHGALKRMGPSSAWGPQAHGAAGRRLGRPMTVFIGSPIQAAEPSHAT